MLSIFVYSILLASSDFCHLLITFANSLDPDQDDNESVLGYRSGYNEFDSLIVFLKEFLEKVNFEKSQQTTTNL